MTQSLLIIDFGSQVTQLIARRIREAGVYCEIHPFQSAATAFARMQPRGVILSGGPASVPEPGSPRAPDEVLRSGVPILGICYGQQTLCHQLGGTVEAGHAREFGRAEVTILKASPLFEGVWEVGRRLYGVDEPRRPGDATAGRLRGDRHIGECAVRHRRRRAAQVLYDDVPPGSGAHAGGSRLLANFAHNIVGLSPDWTMSAYRQAMIGKIRAQVGASKVICGLSGGVDSSVAAVLIHEAIGDQLTCIFVDHGLMRKNEAVEVLEMFRSHYNIPLVHVDAADRFIGALEGEADPETKRKTIGRLFIEVFEAEAKKVGGAEYLAQGTLYPDVIESVSFSGGPSVTIKSHHNVGGLPDRMHLKLVEPLRELFKDEVRALGRELGLPERFVGRHPFPGPGLAIRLPGGVTREKLRILQDADAVYLDEIRKAGLYDQIWQAFAVLLPVRTVGVMGDGRTYDQVVGLRAVTSTDGMTADFFPMPYDVLGRIATRIINEVPGVNRVVYDVTSKPPGTIEWE